jgi:GNAT superfamily N-acetyltransferase
MGNGELLLRPLDDSDSIEELTALLHRAYSRLADMGFRYLATHQDNPTTRERIEDGECCLAVLDEEIVGTLTFYSAANTGGCPWYERLDVSSFGQFAVEPEFQCRGIGSSLIEFAERRAAETGANEIALDTAEGATHLIDYYRRKGYRIVGSADWEETNYTSVIMSKNLALQP